MKIAKSGSRAPTSTLLLCLLLLATLAIYSGGLNGPYLLDDVPNLVYNPHLILHHLSWQALKSAALSSPAGPLRRPIAMLSFALNYSLAGDIAPFSAKLVNVLLHLLTGFCLFLLTRRLLPRLRLFGSASLEPRDVNGAALVVSAVWLLHPLFVSTVLYTVQRMEILSALFTVLGCLIYLEFRSRQIERGDRGYLLIAGIVLFTLLALLSKENGALLPGFLLLLEFFTFRFQRPAGSSRFDRGLLLAVLVIPTLFIPCYLATRFALHWDLQAGARGFTAYQRFLTEFRVLPQYAAWLLFAGGAPMGLFHDDFHLSHSLLQPPTTLLCGLVILAAAAVAALLAPRRHIVSFGLIWFFWGQILESTTLPLALVFEHRNYLPGYGLLLCLGVAAWQGAGLLRRLPALRYGLLGLLLMIPAWQLHQRVSAWSSESAFLVHALNAHPDSSQVLVFAAVYLGNRGDFPAAMKALRRAEELDPGEFAYPWQELALRCHFAPDERIPARLGGRLRHSTAAKPWSPTAKVTFVRAVNACRRTKANDTLLMQLYRSLQPRGGGFFGMYSLLGEANVYWHRHDTRSALAAWEKAVARYPATGRLQPMLQKLKTALQRAGEIPP